MLYPVAEDDWLSLAAYNILFWENLGIWWHLTSLGQKPESQDKIQNRVQKSGNSYDQPARE